MQTLGKTAYEGYLEQIKKDKLIEDESLDSDLDIPWNSLMIGEQVA